MLVRDFYELSDFGTRMEINVMDEEGHETILEGYKHTYYDEKKKEHVDEWPEEILNMEVVGIFHAADHCLIELYTKGEKENESN